MFRKKDRQDAIHQANIKRGITSHFARTLKVLQQRHLQTDADEFIYSDDYSNNLCSALEAVFLHGLKDSVTQKNFWSVCAKFTHKDVINQVRGLSQINTEIGLCRAWIRLALNDGLIESYVHSMLVDKKTLVYYYHSYSYLRDHEQPGILKNYFTGLMSLAFKLSFNSSVLNAWNNTSLQLAGLLGGAHVPGARLNAIDSAPKNGSPGASQAVGGEVADASKRKDSGNKLQDEPIVATGHSLETSLGAVGYGRDNGPHSMFSSIQDVEEIRRIAGAKNPSSRLSFSPSESSISSRVSCPDPSSYSAAREDWASSDQESSKLISPALYPRADTDPPRGGEEENEPVNFVVGSQPDTPSDFLSDLQISQETELEHSQASTITVIETSIEDVIESALPLTRPRSRRVTDDEAITISPESIALSLSPSEAIHEPDPHQDMTNAMDSVKTGQSQNAVSVLPSSQEMLGHNYPTWQMGGSSPKASSLSASSLNNADKRGRCSSSPYRTYDEICATLPPLKLDPAEQDAILKKVLGEIDEQADKERAERHRKEHHVQRVQLVQPANDPKDSTPKKDMQNIKTKAATNRYESSSNDICQGADVKSDERIGEKQNQISSREISSSFSQDDKHSVAPSSNSKTQLENGAASEQEVQPSPHRNQSHEKLKLEAGTNVSIPHDDVAETAETCHTGNNEDEKRNPQHKADTHESHRQISVGGEEASSASSTSGFHKSGSFGNSLSSMLGWSSEIEGHQEEDRRRPRQKTRAESFVSMLKSYAGQQLGIGTTLKDVLEGLPSKEDEEDVVDGDSNQPSSDAADASDSDLDGFEILSPLPSTTQGLQDIDTSRMIYLFRVPQEHGLSHQNFTCRGCTRPIGIVYGQPRLCEFDGGLYCFECHENNEVALPSAIIYNWDFSKKKVCIENYNFLQELESHPLYDIAQLNPKLETHVTELATLKILRKQLRYLKSYLFNCTQSEAEKLRSKVWPREHLYDDCSTYSLNDFFQVQTGVLQRFVKDLVKSCSKHVYECNLCCQKGFVCEICRNPRIIYPFEVDQTVRCDKCKAVYHQRCKNDNTPCPKCERWGRRASRSNALDNVNIGRDHPEDYGVSLHGV